MTLVLICMADEYIIHVSDRRLTLASEPQQPTSEHANKAIFLDGRYIFGFTGLAELGGKRTDLWFAEQIQATGDMPLANRLHLLAKQLPAAVRYAPPKYRALAFVGAGFARRGREAPIEPVWISLSNYLKPTGRPGAISPEFRVSIVRHADRKDFSLFSAGAELSVADRAAVNRSVRKARKSGAGIVTIARILAEAIWTISRRNATVGHSLMICTLPRSALNPDGAGAAGVSGGIQFNSTDAAFYFLGPEAEQGIIFGPTTVSPGMMVTDIRMSFGNAEHAAAMPPEIAAIHYQGSGGTKAPDDALCPCGSGGLYKGCHNKA